MQWVRVAAWDALAEELGERLKRGDEIYAEGRLRLEQWEGQDGAHRCGLSVSAWKVEPLGQIGRRAPQREKQPVAE